MELVSSYLNSFEGKLFLVGITMQAIMLLSLADNYVRSKKASTKNDKILKKTLKNFNNRTKI